VLVVDANVLLYLMLEGPKRLEAEALRSADGDWRTSTLAKYEALNALATLRRTGVLAANEANVALERVDRFCSQAEIRVAPVTALEVAHAARISGYDAHYVALARQLECLLVSEDRKLRAVAPDVARSMTEAAGPAER
jgi:predicted nucleic acid-binding protein